MEPDKDKKALDKILEGFSHKRGEDVKPVHQKLTIEDLYNKIEKNEQEIGNLHSKLDAILDRLGEGKKLVEMNRANYRLENSYVDILIFFLNINTCIENDSSINKDFAHYIQTEIQRVLAKYGYKIVDFSEETRDHYDIEYQPILEDFELVRRAIINNEDELIIKGKIYLKLNN